jgi:hypothetical protein
MKSNAPRWRAKRAACAAFIKCARRILALNRARRRADIYETAEDGFFATPLSQDSERATSARSSIAVTGY